MPMTFEECVLFCAANRELVHHFDRLTGSNLSLKGTPVDLAIDQSTGRLNHDLGAFVAFVYECVWIRLPPECFEDEAGG